MKKKEKMKIPVPFAYLIDDDPLNNAVLTRTLQEKNLVETILSSTSADNAMAYFNHLLEKDESFPDVIFVDLNMPGMDGWEFIERFNLRFGKARKAKIVVLSSTRKWSDLVQTEMNDGVDFFIKKPVTTGELERLMVDLS